MANDIKILDHLNIDLDGDGIAERYEIGGMSELPIASVETLGGIKIGENLSITEDGTLNAKASGTSMLSPGAVLYGTEEKVIGKWINGKPLYQKVIPFTTTLQNNVWIETPELIDDKERIIQTFVIANLLYMPIMGNVDRDGSNYVRIWSMRSTICDITHVVIQYTKTTDEENSFNIGMVENINLEQNIDFSNIYSIDERIVGSWVNGKPIYQKVINLSETIVLQSYVWTNVFMIENMEKIIDIECIIGTVLNDGRLRWNCLNNYICGAAEEDNFTIPKCTIIVRYIKTTDNENSFTPDMIIDHENITDAEIAEAAAADKI